MTRGRSKKKRHVMISTVAERFEIHPQTLRMYEREGLINPTRSAGNTRLYDEEAIRRLEVILTLTRDMGVNLAGVEVILNLRQQLEELQEEVARLAEVKQQRDQDGEASIDRRYALVKTERGALVRQGTKTVTVRQTVVTERNPNRDDDGDRE